MMKVINRVKPVCVGRKSRVYLSIARKQRPSNKKYCNIKKNIHYL